MPPLSETFAVDPKLAAHIEALEEEIYRALLKVLGDLRALLSEAFDAPSCFQIETDQFALGFEYDEASRRLVLVSLTIFEPTPPEPAASGLAVMEWRMIETQSEALAREVIYETKYERRRRERRSRITLLLPGIVLRPKILPLAVERVCDVEHILPSATGPWWEGHEEIEKR